MNLCVIGLGSMGKRRIRLLKKILPDAVITGIDQNPERVRYVTEEYKVTGYGSLEEIKERQDCAFVCTPPQFHGALIRECLLKDWHVFSEINLVDDLYEENQKLARERGKVLFLSSTPLYRAEMQYIERRVKESKKPCAYQYHVGQYLPDWHPWDNLKDFFVSRKETNGCREFLAIELPWIQNTFGKIKEVHVVKRRLTELSLDFPDTYLLQLEHEGGSAGNVTVDVVSRQAVRRLEVFHEGLYLRWEGRPDLLYEKNLSTGALEQVQAGEQIQQPGYAEVINEAAYEREIGEVLAVLSGKVPVYGFEEDREILKVIDRIEKE